MRKNFLFVAATAIAALSLAACSSDDDNNTKATATAAAKFSAVIDGQTRAYDTYWDNGDQIGITGTSGDKAYANVAYATAEGDGEFSVVTEGEEIYFQNDDEVTFTAYYPHNASTSITANTHEQGNQKQFDFLYATATGKKAQPEVSLRFKHEMTRVVVTVVPGNGVTFDEVKAAQLSLAGFKNNGQFDALTGSATASGTDCEAWTFANNTDNTAYNAKQTIDTDNSAVSYSMILFPQELTEAMPFAATNIQTYKTTINLTDANANAGDATAKNQFVAGRQYNLKVTLNKTSIKVTSCTIEPWNQVNGGEASAE